MRATALLRRRIAGLALTVIGVSAAGGGSNPVVASATGSATW